MVYGFVGSPTGVLQYLFHPYSKGAEPLMGLLLFSNAHPLVPMYHPFCCVNTFYIEPGFAGDGKKIWFMKAV